MNLYSNLSINIISLVISIISYILLEFFTSYFSTPPIKIKANFITTQINIQNEQNETNQQNNVESQNLQNVLEQTNSSNIIEKSSDWYLEISTINLKASINEGTTKETMENYIGHFEETSRWNGNVGLAAHNRGYQNNYFQNLKDLKVGDEIIYFYNGKQRKYQVTNNQIIKDTNWTTLEETLENTITLITCVENEPEYRRCVQGKEIT